MSVTTLINEQAYLDGLAKGLNVRKHEREGLAYDGTPLSPMYTVTRFVGATLAEYERNGYHDSDFYAIVYNAETDAIETIEYATTRAYCGPSSAHADATPDVIDRAAEVVRRQALATWHKMNNRQRYNLAKGRLVEVVAGRKIKKGTRARVINVTHNPYATIRYGQSAGRCHNHYVLIELLETGEVVRTYQDNLSITNPEDNGQPEQEGERYADNARAAALCNFRSGTEGLLWSVINAGQSLIVARADWGKVFGNDNPDAEIQLANDEQAAGVAV